MNLSNPSALSTCAKKFLQLTIQDRSFEIWITKFIVKHQIRFTKQSQTNNFHLKAMGEGETFLFFVFLNTELRAYHQSHQYASHSQILVGLCVGLPDLEEHPEFRPHHLHKFMR